MIKHFVTFAIYKLLLSLSTLYFHRVWLDIFIWLHYFATSLTIYNINNNRSLHLECLDVLNSKPKMCLHIHHTLGKRKRNYHQMLPTCLMQSSVYLMQETCVVVFNRLTSKHRTHRHKSGFCDVQPSLFLMSLQMVQDHNMINQYIM